MSKKQTKTVTIRIPETTYFAMTEGGTRKISEAITSAWKELSLMRIMANTDIRGVLDINEWLLLSQYGDEARDLSEYYAYDYSTLLGGSGYQQIAQYYGVDEVEFAKKLRGLTHLQIAEIHHVLRFVYEKSGLDEDSRTNLMDDEIKKHYFASYC